MPVDARALTEEFVRLLGFNATVTEQRLDEGILIDIQCDDPGRLIGRQGQTLSQLQYIINRMIYQKDPTASKVTLDVGGYRAQAREVLIAKAKEAAEKVKRWGDIVELEPMNAFDRWIVHNALKNDPMVETHSVPVEGTTKKAILLRPRR